MAVVRIVLCMLVLVRACAAYGQDAVVRQWVFDASGTDACWIPVYMSNYGISGGRWIGDTTSSAAGLATPSLRLGMTATARDYVLFKMRMASTSGATFGSANGSVMFRNSTSDPWYSYKKTTFTSAGDGQWHIYGVYVGGNAYWTGTVKQFRINPSDVVGSRIEIAWVRVAQDLTPPEFELGGYPDNSTTVDSTPTIRILNAQDSGSGLAMMEFYYRTGSSASDADWVADAVNVGPDFPDYRTYNERPAGTWDLSCKVYDKAGNWVGFTDLPEHWIDNLTIQNTSFSTVAGAKTAAGGSVSIKQDVVSAVFPSYFYMQDPQRASGIRVAWSTASDLKVGDVVVVSGPPQTDANYERMLAASSVWFDGRLSTAPLPLLVTNTALGGAAFGQQSAVEAWKSVPVPGSDPPVYDRLLVPGSGLNNIGLLVRATGAVTQVGSGYFYIHDGAGFDDGTTTAKGVRVEWPYSGQVGDWVAVTGNSSCAYSGGHVVRVLRPRTAADVQPL